MKIGTIKNIEIKLHFSTLVIVALVGFYAATFYYNIIPKASLGELILVGLINGLLILLSILIHELMHSIMAQRYGIEVLEIEFHMFGGISKLQEEPKTPKAELIIAIIGPLSSLALGFGLLALYFAPIYFPTFLLVTFFYSGISNVFLGFFNLIPGFPMDGGRVLRAYLWHKRDDLLSATRTASRVGVGFGYTFVFYGFFQIFLFGLLSGFWLVIIGMFLNSTAKQSYLQTVYEFKLSKISVRDIIGIPKIAIPFNILLIDAIRDYFMLYRQSYFPVIQGNSIVGIIHIEDIKKIPIELRHDYIVGYVMKKISDFPFVTEEKTGRDIIQKFRQMEGIPHIVVVKDNDNILGFIGKDELIAALKFVELHHSLPK